MTTAHSPLSAKREIGYQLVGMGRRWRQTLNARLAQQGLSDAVWTPLVHLHKLGNGVSQSELAAAVGIEGSSLVRLLDTLVEQGLVERQPHASDRRIKQLNLTPAGQTTVASIRTHIEAVEDALLADLDETSAQTLLAALDNIKLRMQVMHQQAAQ